MPNFNLCNYLLTHVHAFTPAILSAPLVAQMVQNLPAVQEIQVQSLGWDDPLEKGTATHSSGLGASLVAQMIKKMPAMQEIWV